jgi:hypothetical protein
MCKGIELNLLRGVNVVLSFQFRGDTNYEFFSLTCGSDWSEGDDGRQGLLPCGGATGL